MNASLFLKGPIFVGTRQSNFAVDAPFKVNQGRLMHSPPDPGIPAFLLHVARNFGFVLISDGLGTIDGHSLTVERTAPGQVQWLIVRGDLPNGLAPRLFSRATYDLLRQGEAQSDGSLAVQGKSYRLSDCWDGQRLVGDLLQA